MTELSWTSAVNRPGSEYLCLIHPGTPDGGEQDIHHGGPLVLDLILEERRPPALVVAVEAMQAKIVLNGSQLDLSLSVSRFSLRCN